MHLRNCSCRLISASLLLAFSLVALAATRDACAQPTSDFSSTSRAEARLKAIYDQGAFRAKTIQATWLSDSSGVLVDEFEPNAKASKAWIYDTQTGERRSPTVSDKELDQSEDNRSLKGKVRVESRAGQLIAIDQNTLEEIELVARKPGREIEYRNQSLSPDHTRLLFVEADFTEVRQRPVLLPSDPSYPKVDMHRFARVGGEIEKLRIGVVNTDGSDLSWLPIDCPKEGMYLGQVEWAGRSDEVLIERFSRFRDKRDILLVGTNGSLKTIFSDWDEAWVESSQGKNSGLVWLPNRDKFVVISEKDGWRHAFLYSREGEELSLLTQGDYDIIDRAVIDHERGWYYFYASPNDATQRYLYRVSLDGSGEKQCVSPVSQVGTHSYQFSPDAKWAIHTFSTLNAPPVHELIEVDSHRVVRVLESNQEILDRMKTLNCEPAEFLKLDIGNSIVLDAWMLKPKDFDPTKKYPLFIYVYGEPHAQTVLNEWGAAQIDFHRVVAELGYIVVSIDNRGTPAPKGAAWRRAIFGSLGPLSTDEQEAGLNSLAKQCPYVDTDRVGIWGWSGGGSNTLNALFRKPDSYHLGIAVVPKPQPHLYNAWFQEIYMRDLESNSEGYERSAPINFAEGLKGKLLIITGSGETNTHIQIIEGLVDRLISLGKPFDYMVYPNRDHGLREGDGTVVHVRMCMLRYLQSNLPAGPW